eukprot:SAG31_NODE_990_length_10529_cov_37.528340_13_plen_65_part_00
MGLRGGYATSMLITKFSEYGFGRTLARGSQVRVLHTTTRARRGGRRRAAAGGGAAGALGLAKFS